jgi:hypothetical protein
MNYTVKSIQFAAAKEWVIKKHYAKRVPPIQYAFGLFEGNILIGVVTFGTPVSSTLRDLWNGKYKLMELNRLVVNDGLPKNTLSYFVSSALKQLPQPLVIVSYADTSQNHHGYIYQATNFVYTGLSIKFKDWYVKGQEHMHHSTIEDLARGQENRVEWLREKFGDLLYMRERPQKHRYFYFVGNKHHKRKMQQLLPYNILPYPKGDNIRYNADFQPTIQTTLF